MLPFYGKRFSTVEISNTFYHDVALCIAEADNNLQVPFEAAAAWGYLRLRKMEYTPASLKAWAKQLRKAKWGDVFLFFKHEEAGRGSELAKEFGKLAASAK